ncbi:MAG: hypothetical protein KAT48_04800 [Bacteroidales bacterium]|nr:hypothetical protein [Bacteroidales bacterium]
MIALSRNNYEIFFLDYLEGTLKPDQVADLILFMEQNPDLKEEFNHLELVYLTPDNNIQFENKQRLKKNIIVSVGVINHTNYHDYFIADLEGDLPKTDTLILHKFLAANPFLKPDFETYKKTVFIPDDTIVYRSKKHLKKNIIHWNRILYYSTGIAAAIVILLWLFAPSAFIMQKNQVLTESTEPGTKITETPSAVKPKPQIEIVESQEGGIQSTDVTNDESFPEEISNTKTEQVFIHPDQSHVELIAGEMVVINRLPGLHKKNKFKLVPDNEIENGGIILREGKYHSDIQANTANAGEQMADDYIQAKQNNFKSLVGFAYAKIKNIFKKENEDTPNEAQFSLWSLADLGMYGISQATNGKLKLNRVEDENGHLIAYALVSDNLEISKIISLKSGKKNKELD